MSHKYNYDKEMLPISLLCQCVGPEGEVCIFLSLIAFLTWQYSLKEKNKALETDIPRFLGPGSGFAT